MTPWQRLAFGFIWGSLFVVGVAALTAGLGSDPADPTLAVLGAAAAAWGARCLYVVAHAD